MSLRVIGRSTAALIVSLGLQVQAAAQEIQVFKTPTCGCCGKWVEHLKANGFNPIVTEVPATAEYRTKYGIPAEMASCHTAVIAGYAIEGHVPAAEIRTLLKARPKAKGLAVPGMPLGSPGMEAGRRQAYSVMLIDPSGRISVYKQYPGD